jgi:heterodisulfide reductase subunit A-like polyferredoxin
VRGSIAYMRIHAYVSDAAYCCVPLARFSFTSPLYIILSSSSSPSSPHHAQRPNNSSPRMLSFLSSAFVQCTSCRLVQRRTHESVKKAALQIRFVIVGGGPAGLACAVALRRVGHHVIVLEKGPDFIGVRTTPVPFKLAPSHSTCSHHSLTQPSRNRGFRSSPNMTKIFNYWAMRDKVDKIGIITDRVILAKRTCCTLLAFVFSCHCLTALNFS